jgi:transcription-repair coupling factor (superfamily II helicase)
LVITEDAESAAYLQNTLENLTNALDLFYFPSSFKNRKNFSLLNSSHVMLRTESLMRWSAGGNKKLMVSYPEALFEKVVLPGTLSVNTIYINFVEAFSIYTVMEMKSHTALSCLAMKLIPFAYLIPKHSLVNESCYR